MTSIEIAREIIKQEGGSAGFMCGNGAYRYIKVLPEEPKPPVKKYTTQEYTTQEYTIQEIADKLGVLVETIRIKDK